MPSVHGRPASSARDILFAEERPASLRSPFLFSDPEADGSWGIARALNRRAQWCTLCTAGSRPPWPASLWRYRASQRVFSRSIQSQLGDVCS